MYWCLTDVKHIVISMKYIEGDVGVCAHRKGEFEGKLAHRDRFGIFGLDRFAPDEFNWGLLTRKPRIRHFRRSDEHPHIHGKSRGLSPELSKTSGLGSRGARPLQVIRTHLCPPGSVYASDGSCA